MMNNNKFLGNVKIKNLRYVETQLNNISNLRRGEIIMIMEPITKRNDK